MDPTNAAPLPPGWSVRVSGTEASGHAELTWVNPADATEVFTISRAGRHDEASVTALLAVAYAERDAWRARRQRAAQIEAILASRLNSSDPLGEE